MHTFSMEASYDKLPSSIVYKLFIWWLQINYSLACIVIHIYI